MPVYMRNKLGKMCKKGEKGRWYYDFQIANVRYREAIPEATNKRQAEIAEARARTEVFNGTYGQRKSRVSLRQFINDEFLKWSRAHKRSWKHDEYYAEIFCPFFGDKPLIEISPLLIEQFKRHRVEEVTTRGERRSKATVNRELGALSKMFQHAADMGFLEINPCRKVKLFGIPKQSERDAITREDEGRILAVLTGKYANLRPVVILALNTGMRRGELFSIEWSDVDFEQRLIRLRPEITKTGRGRNLPMNDEVFPVLQELQKKAGEDPKVFSFRRDDAGAKFSAICAALGLKASLHWLRHTFSTRLAESGVHPAVIRDLMGHQNMRLTDIYTHVVPDTMRKAVEKLQNQAECLNNVTSGGPKGV